MYLESTQFVPWMGAGAGHHYAAMSPATGTEHGAAWPYGVAVSQEGPSMFGATDVALEMPNHELMVPATTVWSPSVSPYPTAMADYSTTAFPFPVQGQVAEPSMWESSDYASSLSPYSDTAGVASHPPLTRSVSDDGLGTYSAAVSAPDSPESDATTSSAFPAPSQPTSRRNKNNPRSAARAARRTADSTPRPKSPAARPRPSRTSSNVTEFHYQNQLRSRLGHRIGPVPPYQDPRATTEHIRREAWRICKAEALEMSQRRMKLLEHEHGALERETQQLQINMKLMRDAVAREQLDLENAVDRAEML